MIGRHGSGWRHTGDGNPDHRVQKIAREEYEQAQWPFDQAENCAVFTTAHVMTGQEPILRVVHDLDDHGWQFLGASGAIVAEAMVVALSEVVDLDSSVRKVADIPPGWCAERSSMEGDWVRTRNKSTRG